MTKISIAAMFAAFTISASAGAQTPPTSPDTAAPSTDLTDTPPPNAMPVPQVSDPMLTPPTDAAKKIQSWNDALSLVRSRSPDYLFNFETIKRAEAQTRIALASLLPIVNGQGTYAHNFLQVNVPFNGAVLTTPPPDVLTAAATATWTPLNPRAYYDYETSKKAVNATVLSFEDKRRQIAASVVSAILATLSSARVADLNRVGLRSSLERLHLTEARLQFGQGTPLDVDRANADVAASRRSVIDGDESVRRAHEQLGIALGSRDPLSVSSDLDLEKFEQAVASSCHLNEVIENRPDVQAARERVMLAKRAVKSAELAPLPSVGVGSQGAYTNAPVLAPNGSFSVQAFITVPFYDGGLRYGQLRDARAVEEQANASLEATRLNAVVTAARAKRGVDVSRADRDVAKSERDLAEKIDLRTRDAYARGRGTSLDLVTSAQALRLAEINLAILDFQLAEARADAVLENAECAF
jgi:outer membrane protein, multidrug efflux system